MHNTADIESCFLELSKAENLEQVDFIPSCSHKRYVSTWKWITEISLYGSVAEIELYIGISDKFPYILPDFYFFEQKYDYFPHIDHNTRKLCYLEDGITYDTTDYLNVLQFCLNRAKRLISDGANKTNVSDFKTEINSYWLSTYNKEPFPLLDIILYGDLPQESTILDLYLYKEQISDAGERERCVMVCSEDENTAFTEFIQGKSRVSKKKALFLKSVTIPQTPPYSISFLQLIEMVDEADLKIFRRHLNSEHSLILVFRLFNSNRFGGIIIENQPTKRKGFRNNLTVFDVLSKFEKRNQPFQRIMGELYSIQVKNKRCDDTSVRDNSFAIIGLGSVGSNLCYYLNGLSDSRFILIDNDILRSENTGRHLLGFRYIGQAKSVAMCNFIKERNPEICVKTYEHSILAIFDEVIDQINSCSAIFVCVGDSIVEDFILKNVTQGNIKVPLYLMWVEPFSIAGHMVYINPYSASNTFSLVTGDQLLYKYNLIHPKMYAERSAEFVESEAGCNASYALYSQNNVTLFLSAMYPIINKLLDNPCESKCYRWTGNINVASQKKLLLTNTSTKKGEVLEFPI